MKTFLKLTAITGFLALILHGIVWVIGKDLVHEKKAEARTFDRKNITTIRQLRLELERKQKKDIESYGWHDRAKARARIPVRRAFSYYLESLSH